MEAVPLPEVTFMSMIAIGLLILVAVIGGLVLLARALPPGSGPKVTLGVGGLLVCLLLPAIFYVKSSQPTVSRVPVVVQGNSSTFDHDPTAAAVAENWLPSIPVFSRLLLILIAAAVLVGILYLIYHMAQSPSGRTVLSVGGIGLVCLVMFFLVSYDSLERLPNHQVRGEYDETSQNARRALKSASENNLQGASDPLIAISPKEAAKPNPNRLTVVESETKTVTPDENEGKSTAKPAWLTEGLQTGNGLTQFPVASELYATVAECQRDLDQRMAGIIASEIQRLFGEDAAITLRTGEGQQFIADTYTEENQTSQGTWYKVHRLVKIDETARASLQLRFQEAQLQTRLVSLGLGLGGVLLVLGVVYLFLSRAPRSVDPTQNTFSTT